MQLKLSSELTTSVECVFTMGLFQVICWPNIFVNVIIDQIMAKIVSMVKTRFLVKQLICVKTIFFDCDLNLLFNKNRYDVYSIVKKLDNSILYLWV